jgi:hypothetical protein
MTADTEAARVADIAAKLTEAQRRAFTDGVYFEDRFGGRYRMRAHGKVKWNLCCQRLLHDYLGAPALTDLGLRVRQHLQEQTDDH